MSAGMKYTRLDGDDESSTALFDYSSPFTYSSTDPADYRSAFKYSVPVSDSTDVGITRGLEQKSTLVKFAHRLVIALIYIVIIVTFPISLWFVVKKIKDDQQMIVSRLGIIRCIRGPTIAAIIPIVDQTKTYSTSLRAFNIPPQKVMTCDGLLVELGGILKYHITDAEKACFAAQDIDHTMRVTAQTVASRYIHGTKEKDLTDSMNVNCINLEIRAELQKTFLQWGVAVQSYEISGLKAVLRIEQQDALSNVIGPLKQWFFGGSDTSTPAEGSPAAHMAGTPFAQMAGSMLANAHTASKETAPLPGLSTTGFAQHSATQSTHPVGAPDMASLRHSLSPTDLLTAVKSITTSALVQEVRTVYKFVVPDDCPGVYFMDLKNGNGDCGPGEPPLGKADTTITISLADMQRMFTGALQPFNAYMSGALKVDGDTGGAMKLDSLVKSIAAMTQVSS